MKENARCEHGDNQSLQLTIWRIRETTMDGEQGKGNEGHSDKL